MMAGCCCAEACTAAVLIGVMRLPGCLFDSAWCLVCEVCRLTVDCVDSRCFLSFVFLGGARRLELSPCNTHMPQYPPSPPPRMRNRSRDVQKKGSALSSDHWPLIRACLFVEASYVFLSVLRTVHDISTHATGGQSRCLAEKWTEWRRQVQCRVCMQPHA